MPHFAALLAVVFTLNSACLFAGDLKIRDQTREEELRLQMSSDLGPAGERARDYSLYVGKTLSQIGIQEEFVVTLGSRSDGKASDAPRPSDAAIRSAITDFVLQLFPESSSYRDFPHRSRVVNGRLQDGRACRILFVGDLPAEASIDVNQYSCVEFQLKKKP